MDTLPQDLDPVIDQQIDLLAARVVSLENDVEVYRLIAQQAIHALHGITADRDRLREQHRAAREELRAIREQVITANTLLKRRAA